MMMRLLIAVLALCCGPALAQTPPPNASDSIAGTIGRLIIQNAQNEALIAAQRAQIEQLQKQIEKPAPPPPGK